MPTSAYGNDALAGSRSPHRSPAAAPRRQPETTRCPLIARLPTQPAAANLQLLSPPHPNHPAAFPQRLATETTAPHRTGSPRLSQLSGDILRCDSAESTPCLAPPPPAARQRPASRIVWALLRGSGTTARRSRSLAAEQPQAPVVSGNAGGAPKSLNPPAGPPTAAAFATPLFHRACGRGPVAALPCRTPVGNAKDKNAIEEHRSFQT